MEGKNCTDRREINRNGASTQENVNSEILNPVGNVQLSADQNVNTRKLPEVEQITERDQSKLLGAHAGLEIFCFPLATVENT